jgi:hypothetical protein
METELKLSLNEADAKALRQSTARHGAVAPIELKVQARCASRKV